MKRLLLLLSVTLLSLAIQSSAQELYKVTYTAGEGGTLKACTMDYMTNTETDFESGAQFAEGTTLRFYAMPKDGYELSHWKVNGYKMPSNPQSPNKLEIPLPPQPLTVEAFFKASATPESYRVTFSAGEGGQLTATYQLPGSASQDLNSGESLPKGTYISLFANPSDGYKLQKRVINNTDVSPDENHPNAYFFTLSENRDIKAVFEKISEAPKTYTVTYVAGEGGSLTAIYYDKDFKQVTLESGGTVPEGVTVYLTATPNEGYEVGEWFDNGKPVDMLKGRNLFGVKVQENKNIRVTFIPKQCKVTYTAGEGGTVEAVYYVGIREVTVTSGDMVPRDVQLYLTATPNEGYEVGEWFVNDTPVDYFKGNSSMGVKIDEPKDIRVSFVSQGGPKRFTVDFSASDGGTLSATYKDQYMVINSLESGTTLPEGTFINFLAIPHKGYKLQKWVVNDEDVMPDPEEPNKYAYNLHNALTLKAIFESTGEKPASYPVTYTAGEGGRLTGYYYDDASNRVTFESGESVPQGVMVNLLATPNDGYAVDEWYQDGVPAGDFFKGADHFTLVVNKPLDVRVTFRSTSTKPDTYTVQLITVGDGDVKLSGAEYYDEVPKGTTITVSATPDEGRRLVYIKANQTDITEAARVVIEENTTIVVAFGLQSYPVKIEVEGKGDIKVAPDWVNLDSVFYNQELTLQPVSENEHWILEELTANGSNILGDLKVTIKEPTTIHAKFVDHTSIATLEEAHQTLYPNPAREQVTIEGLAPGTRVMLYDLRGALVAETLAGESHVATIDLTDLPAGRYIVQAGDTSYSLIVQ